MKVIILLLALASPALAQNVIVDNSDGAPEFITTGNDWTDWGTNGYGFNPSDNDYLYLSHTIGGSDRRGMAIWSPNLPEAGTYKIGTWFRRTENRSSDADFFVLDGNGDDRRIVVNQRGEGPSGWVNLGTYFCNAGPGGCRVTLDGTDDDHSDEANAVRFRRVSGAPPGDSTPAPEPEPEPPSACTSFPGMGPHTQQGFATVVKANAWDDRNRATGSRDGRGAHTPNLDGGEYIRGRGWTICDPPGEETITSVRIAVRGRTQYQSGTYNIRVRLDAAGDARAIWNGTEYRWRGVNVTGDRATWTWDDVAGLVANIRLHDHPNGRRDSDVWVDAFRVRVGYTTTAAPSSARDDDLPIQPEEDGACDDECVDPSDWWWEGENDAGSNADGTPEDDSDEDPGAPADDDAAASDEDDGGDSDTPGDDPDPDPFGPDSGEGSGSVDDGYGLVQPGCGSGATAALLLMLPLGLRRRLG